MVKNKKLFDEHETINISDDVIDIKRTKVWNKVLALLLIISVITFSIYIAKIMIERKREKQKIDEIIASIQSEIFIKQCQLDKMYCCGYKEQTSCDKWVEKGCTEPDGALEINCTSILENSTKN